MDWTNQSLATMGSNLPSVNLKKLIKNWNWNGCSWFEKQDFKVEVENNFAFYFFRKEEEKKEE
jgi:hypothetical protein